MSYFTAIIPQAKCRKIQYNISSIAYAKKIVNYGKEKPMQNLDEIKAQICDVCHKMWQLGWVAANDGNVSVRLEDGNILAKIGRAHV